MTAMSRAASMLDEALSSALEHEKSLFLARNTDRCAHLLVRCQAEHEHDRLVVTAAFTLDAARRWQQAEAVVALHLPAADDSYRQRVAAAFDRLDESIGTARIARLFAPLPVARRMARGRD